MRILLADDEPKVRRALRLLLEQQGGVRVTGEAGRASEVLVEAETTLPDLILLDWGLPDMDGADLLPILRQRFPHLAVVVLSGQPEVEEAALGAGAAAFVSKADPPERLLAAILSSSASRSDTQSDR